MGAAHSPTATLIFNLKAVAFANNGFTEDIIMRRTKQDGGLQGICGLLASFFLFFFLSSSCPYSSLSISSRSFSYPPSSSHSFLFLLRPLPLLLIVVFLIVPFVFLWRFLFSPLSSSSSSSWSSCSLWPSLLSLFPLCLFLFNVLLRHLLIFFFQTSCCIISSKLYMQAAWFNLNCLTLSEMLCVCGVCVCVCVCVFTFYV